MRYLSLLHHGEIVEQVQTTLTDEQVIEIDNLLRGHGVFDENAELAITTDID